MSKRIIEMPEGDYEEITSSRDIRSELAVKAIACPEWPGPSGRPGLYFVSELIGADFDAYQAVMFEIEGSEYTLNMSGSSIRLLAYALVKRNGERLWPNVEVGIKEIGQKGQGGIDRLATVARALNGLATDAAKSAEGKSSAPASSSSSDSPSDWDIPAEEPSFST